MQLEDDHLYVMLNLQIKILYKFMSMSTILISTILLFSGIPAPVCNGLRSHSKKKFQCEVPDILPVLIEDADLEFEELPKEVKLENGDKLVDIYEPHYSFSYSYYIHLMIRVGYCQSIFGNNVIPKLLR